MEYIKSKVRDVMDFPKKGIVFKDLTTVFKDPRALHIIGWDLSQLYRDKGVTKVVGIESRGFIGGSILAFELGAGFVPARKPGKLPADTVSCSYDKEYGKDTIEIHRDAITPDDIVVIHDDVLATGGTMAAVYNQSDARRCRSNLPDHLLSRGAVNSALKNIVRRGDMASLAHIPSAIIILNHHLWQSIKNLRPSRRKSPYCPPLRACICTSIRRGL